MYFVLVQSKSWWCVRWCHGGRIVRDLCSVAKCIDHLWQNVVFSHHSITLANQPHSKLCSHSRLFPLPGDSRLDYDDFIFGEVSFHLFESCHLILKCCREYMASVYCTSCATSNVIRWIAWIPKVYGLSTTTREHLLLLRWCRVLMSCGFITDISGQTLFLRV